MAGDQGEADGGAGDQGEEDRGGDGAAEEEAHRRRQLDVAEAHAARVGEGGEEEEAAAAAAAIARSGRLPGSVGAMIARPTIAPASRTLLGMIRCSRSVRVTAASIVVKTRSTAISAGSSQWTATVTREEDGDGELGQRVAGRDRRAAAAGAAAQRQPAEYRDVVAGGDRGAAGRAFRAGQDERHPARHPVRDGGGEAAGGESEEEGEEDGSGHGVEFYAGRRLPTRGPTGLMPRTTLKRRLAGFGRGCRPGRPP